ncbi:MAG: recombinase family protein [Candidatus Paceibacterota bacterium]|jgi:site-specific DNA recombinase
MSLQENKKLVAVYGRVSTSNQENEGTIETQLSSVREFAKANGLLIVKEYLDEGWSGDTLVRPNLDQLRQDANKKVWEAVLVYDPDRIARRYSYQELVMDELKEKSIEVIFVTVSAPKNPEDKILHGVRGLFAEYERAKITERFRLGRVRKAREGHIIASEAPYGYTFIPKKDGRHGYYEINTSEIDNLKKIFSFVGDDRMTIKGVVRKLQELGIPPRKSKRGVWNTSTIGTLLKNKTYIGEGHYASTYAVVPEKPIKINCYKKIKKTSRRTRPEEEWIKIPTPVIIDKDLFARVQEQLKINFAQSKRNKINKYLLSSKIACVCGCKRVGEGPQHGRYLYYRCTNRQRNFPLPPTCSQKGIDAQIVDRLVWEKFLALMSSPVLIQEQVSRWLKRHNNSLEAENVDTDSLKKEIEKLKLQEDRYNKAYGAGVFTLDTLKEYTQPLRERISSIESKLVIAEAAVRQSNATKIPEEDQIKLFANKAKEMLSDLNFEAKKDIVMSTIDEITSTNEELSVFGRLPITSPIHVGYKTSNRNRRSSKCR